MKSYAQDKEDIIIKSLLPNVKGGFYIDVGANNPDIFSVTKSFYIEGWRGINIEPLPDQFGELVKERAEDINLNIGISNNHSKMKLYVNGMASTFDVKIAEYEKIGKNNSIEVEVYTLKEILNKYNPETIHFCKIDVEGYEKLVLEGMDWNYRPLVFCIEAMKPMTATPCYKEWEYLLLEHGYYLYYSHGINRYYVSHEYYKLLKDKYIQDVSELLRVMNCDELYVYGAGKFCKALLDYCSKTNEFINRIKNIVVSQKENNPTSVAGIAVIPLEMADVCEESTVIVAVFEKYNFEIREKLLKTGARLVFISNDVFYQLEERGELYG